MEKDNGKVILMREYLDNRLEGQHTSFRDCEENLIFVNDNVKVYDQMVKEFFEGTVKFDQKGFYIESKDGIRHSRWSDYIVKIVSTILI